MPFFAILGVCVYKDQIDLYKIKDTKRIRWEEKEKTKHGNISTISDIRRKISKFIMLFLHFIGFEFLVNKKLIFYDILYHYMMMVTNLDFF